ncbi:MAG: hypothetical protein IIA55_14890 [Gemmatimonadetes bacterium]|nr:hypothetical protein [Gemmatimonadota bacterium]
MRHYMIAAVLASLVPTVAHAQNARLRPVIDMGKSIPISVRVPPAMPGIDQAVRTQLEARLSRVLTGTGLAAVPGGANFVMYPSLVVLEERIVEGSRGMMVVKLDLSLFVKSVSDGVLFASISKVVGGAGRTRNAALLNAVSSLQGNDPDLRDFSQAARDRILDYYSQRCDQIILDAETAAQTGNVDQALASLLGVPDVVTDCHQAASDVAVAIFISYQQQQCESHIRGARASMAVDNFGEAIVQVSLVDPGSPCADEADQLISDMDRDVQAGVEREALAAEQARRAAIKPEIASPEGARQRQGSLMEAHATLYFNRQPRPAIDPSIYGNL